VISLRRAPVYGLRLCILFFCFSVAASTWGCASGAALASRTTAQLRLAATPFPMSWLAPEGPGDGAALELWRGSVGAPIFVERLPVAAETDEIELVSWNADVGEGDLVRFLRTLSPGRPLVVLLQEAVRRGADVPSRLDPGASFARRLGCARCRDVADTAGELGLSLYYVPSMRNGGADSVEDRGNAILSNLPLTDLTAIELPFERQRRVAIAATIAGRRLDGMPWTLRLVDAHLDNMGGPRRGWIGAEFGRARQARGLVGAIAGDAPTVLAGDFNTWFGFSEAGYVETARAFPDTRVTDRRPTFRGLLRLDHVFFRLAAGWRGEFRRGDDRFGSDHYPLIGRIRFR
jgi:endonuclease/exonuclease/phosphatase family metal-dependent hydrolase